MVLRTMPLYDGTTTVHTGTPQDKRATVGSRNIDPRAFPTPTASEGPDYGIGDPYYPHWVDSHLRAEELVFVRANYGQAGSIPTYANEGGEFGPNPGSGATEFSTGKVRTLKWDPEPLPGFDPRIAQWNVLPYGNYGTKHIPSVKTHADYNNSAGQQNLAGPLNYLPAGVASLVGPGLAGS